MAMNICSKGIRIPRIPVRIYASEFGTSELYLGFVGKRIFIISLALY